MNEILYEILSKLTALPVIRAYENGIEPAEPFITYELKLAQTPEHLLVLPIDESGNRRLKTHVDATLELQCFGKPSLSILREIAMKAHTESNRTLWEQNGVVLVDVGKLTHLAYLDEAKQYHDRAVLELFIRYTTDIDETLHVIETVQADHDLAGLTGTQTIGI